MIKFLAAPLAAAFTFTLFVLPAAAAEPGNDTAIKMVSTSGLNPASRADQAVLRHGIAVAAHQVCDQVTQGAPAFSAGYQECVSQAIADATAQLTAAKDHTLVASAR